jgi:hypothetical protein
MRPNEVIRKCNFDVMTSLGMSILGDVYLLRSIKIFVKKIIKYRGVVLESRCITK